MEINIIFIHENASENVVWKMSSILSQPQSVNWYKCISRSQYRSKLEQLERLCSEDTPRRPMITHTIDQFILNPKSILLTSSYRIPSQNKVKAEKLEKFAQKFKF